MTFLHALTSFCTVANIDFSQAEVSLARVWVHENKADMQCLVEIAMQRHNKMTKI